MERLSLQTHLPFGHVSGHLFVISAPSGAGKTTLCRAILNRFDDLLYSISYTTRPPRKGEKNGMDYYFISKEEFGRGVRSGKWAEWAEVYGNFYGTCAEIIDNGLASGKDILLDIDVQGTRQIVKQYPHAVTFFIMPPSLHILKKRLESRGTDSSKTIARRLVAAEKEMAHKHRYRHIIVNDQLAKAVSELASLIETYRNESRSNVIDRG